MDTTRRAVMTGAVAVGAAALVPKIIPTQVDPWGGTLIPGVSEAVFPNSSGHVFVFSHYVGDDWSTRVWKIKREHGKFILVDTL